MADAPNIFGADALTYPIIVGSPIVVTVANGAFSRAIYRDFYNNGGAVLRARRNGANVPSTFSKVAGEFPEDVDLQGSLVVGTPRGVEVFTGPVTEADYPINYPAYDIYYFVIRATATLGLQYGETLFHINVYRDWSDIRDEFVQKIINQDFSIERSLVTNLEYDQYRIDRGDYL